MFAPEYDFVLQFNQFFAKLSVFQVFDFMPQDSKYIISGEISQIRALLTLLHVLFDQGHRENLH